MFSEYYSFLRINPKWAKLINLVRADSEKSQMFIVDVNKNYITVTDGNQILRIEKPRDVELLAGYYILSDRLFVPIPDERNTVEWALIDETLKRERFTKTAMLDMNERPLSAIGVMFKEFGVLLDIDLMKNVLEVLASFKPAFVRAYGFADPNDSAGDVVKLEMLVEPKGSMPVVVEYAIRPLKAEKKLVKVDNQPMLFDIKNV
ncbi:MAG: hypothetical protein A2Y12_01240 [Planctomycetes bacterium GWF2_42_9]|nr:MAG: hypothetical protein A2Y12_01240 [Planctomycetes bacterium GWF2_42_9]HAL44817.1 hypothetical protein [Phycisphaerales bacterium]